MNQAIVRGTMSSEPEFRVLASGTSLATLQVTTRPADGHAISVPISITEPPAWLATAVAGDEVLVVGVVRRRFFQAGSATASRVEIEAHVVAKTSDKRAVRKALRLAQVSLDTLVSASG